MYIKLLVCSPSPQTSIEFNFLIFACAIFLHIAHDDYRPTEGCIALNQEDLLFILNSIDKKTNLVIGD